jgi:serine/threonine protein kinase
MNCMSEGIPQLLFDWRGDLSAIVLTALCKDPQRRYSTVEQLSEDIRAVASKGKS